MAERRVDIAEVTGSSPVSSTILERGLASLPRRAVAKTVTYRVVSTGVKFLAFYAVTGSWELGGLLVIVDAVISTILYYGHERLWSTKIKWGKRKR